MPPKKRPSRKRAGATNKATAQTAPNASDGSGEEDSGSSRPTPEQEGNSKKVDKRQQPLHLTAEQQDDILLWFKENELLYDKGHADYKLTEKKNALWKDKADELGLCDGPRLKCWVDSIRTQYGKLSKRPSGSGGRLSERDKWILDKLSFLSKHIYRIPSRGGVDLMAKIRQKHPDRILDTDESGEEEENREDDRVEQPPSTSPSIATASGEQDTSAVVKRKKKSSGDESTALIQRLQDRIQKSSQLQEKLIDQMSAPTDLRLAERHQWAQWFGAAITDIDDSLWSEFQSESLQMVNTFKARSKRMQQASVQPSQMQPPPMQPSSMQSADQERTDYNTARRLQTINYSSNPGGYLPIWQQIYQPPPRPMFPPQPAYTGRSHLAPLSTTLTKETSATVSSMDNAGPTYSHAQGTPTDVNAGDQTDSLRELMTYSGIPAVHASCDSDILNVV